MRERFREPAQIEAEKPLSFEPTEEKIDTGDIINEINKTQKQEPIYWSCGNGAYRHSHCGCEDGTDVSKPGGWGAGGRPGSPIYYSTNRSDWHTPIRVVVRNGVIVGSAG